MLSIGTEGMRCILLLSSNIADHEAIIGFILCTHSI